MANPKQIPSHNVFRAIIVVWIFATSFSHSDDDKCSHPWIRIGKGCYLLQSERVSADEGFALCLKQGAHLATFETMEELMLVKYELQQMKTGNSYFIGGRNINRFLPRGDWRWIADGQYKPMKYIPFASTQKKLVDECMLFYAAECYAVHDHNCDRTRDFGYMCEK